MTEQLLARAAAGDENAFRELTDPFRHELQLHCYRILGSMQDAEEALQETMFSAWRSLGRFEGRAPVRSWLCRIATNRCLNALRDARRRPSQEVPMPAFQPPEPTRLAEPSWLEPYADVLLDALPDAAPGPETRYETKEAVGLAFVAALQHLPPRFVRCPSTGGNTREHPRKHWGSRSAVLACSRLFPARGTAKGPQERRCGPLRGFARRPGYPLFAMHDEDTTAR